MRAGRAKLFLCVMMFGLMTTDCLLGQKKQRVAESRQPEVRVQLAISSEAIPVNATVVFQGTVLTGDLAATHMSVTFRIKRPGGTTNITVQTNKSGMAEWRYRAQIEGSYQVTLTAISDDGAVHSVGPLTFTAGESQTPQQPRSSALPGQHTL